MSVVQFGPKRSHEEANAFTPQTDEVKLREGALRRFDECVEEDARLRIRIDALNQRRAWAGVAQMPIPETPRLTGFYYTQCERIAAILRRHIAAIEAADALLGWPRL